MLRRLFCVGIVLSFLLVWTQTITPSVVALQSTTQTPLPTATPSPIPVNKIAFTMPIEDADGEGFHSQIFVLDLAYGSTPVNWSNNAYDEREPVWSPDGTRLAFTSNRNAIGERVRHIYVANVDGSNLIQLTSRWSIDTDPEWTHDSRLILFSSLRNGNKEDIFNINSDGSSLNKPARMTNIMVREYDPDWSILNKIVFAVADPDTQNGEIYTMNPNNGGRNNISQNPANDENPTWSPDGKEIIFTSDRVVSGQNDIYIMVDYAHSSPKLIVSSADAPAWSPDGTQIVYSLRHEVKGMLSYRLMLQYLNFPLQIILYQNTAMIDDLDWSPGQANIPAACNFALPPEDCTELLGGLMGIDVTRQPTTP